MEPTSSPEEEQTTSAPVPEATDVGAESTDQTAEEKVDLEENQPDEGATPAPEDGQTPAQLNNAETPNETSEPLEIPASSDGAQPAPADEDLVEIKFVILPEGFLHYALIPSKERAAAMYTHLSEALLMERSTLRITVHGRQLGEEEVINEALDTSFTPVAVNVESTGMFPRHLLLLHKYEQCTRVSEVRIEYGEGIPPKLIHVCVVRGYHHKQFVGGLRNKRDGTVYHHAVAQTDGRVKPPRQRPLSFTRVTQTAGISRSQQTKREAWTQMKRPGLDLDCSEDRWYTPRPYFSADSLHALRVAKTIVIQAHVRGWFARRLAKRTTEEEEQRRAERRQADEAQRKIFEQKRQRELERRMHPRTAADFNILYNELEAWRLQETAKIADSGLSEEEKNIARQELLRKETRLLQTIDRLQIQANVENKKEGTTKMLGAMAAHKVWKHRGGIGGSLGTGHTVVETPFTVRARELLDLYNGLQVTTLSVDERLDILLHVKWTVKEFECALTREIVELVDREADLLNRGRKPATLMGLRQRVSNLFLQFCETPEFNPEAINHQRVALEFTTRPLVKLDATKR